MSKEVQEKEFSVKRRRRLPENGRRLATHSGITMSHRKRTSTTSSLITPSLHIKQLTIHLLHVPINQKRFTSSTVMRRSRRVHEEPKVASHASPCSQPFSAPNKLTVWQKSLLFNGRGYTVYDNSTGGLIFRVDNYASDWRIEMFLMDSTGNVLFTIKRSRKKLSFLERWEVFRGEIRDHGKPFIEVTKAFGVSSCKVSSAAGDKYEMRWSAREGWSTIYRMTAGTLLVAEVNKKLGKATPGISIGKDVYTLTVHPGMDQATAMALVMINDAMR